MRRLRTVQTPCGNGMRYTTLPFYSAEEDHSLKNRTGPFTVVEILREVFREDFKAAAQFWLDCYPHDGERIIDGRGARKYTVVRMGEPKGESSLSQSFYQTCVDLVFCAVVRAEFPADTGEVVGEEKDYPCSIRMRYVLDMIGRFCSSPIIVLEENGHPDFISRQNEAVANQYLLPVMKMDDYSTTAESILSFYYSDALKRPTAVDGRALARKVRLNVRRERFEADSSLRGVICFADKTIKTLDESGTPKDVIVRAGTIVVNQILCPTPEIENSTIVHECAHYYLDRHFFMLQALSGNPSYMAAGRSVSVKRYSSVNSPVDWMELQAEKLTAYILMEEGRTRELIEERGFNLTPENMSWVMERLA